MSDTAMAAGPENPAPAKSRRGRRILGLVLVVLVLLLGLSAYLLYRIAMPTGTGGGGQAAETGGLEWVRSIYGMSNNPQDQFNRTQAAVPGPDGSIWVTDGIHQALMRFTPDGQYEATVRSTDASAPLVAPSRFAVDPDGVMYVVETNSDLIRVLRPDGTVVGSIGVPKPVSVAVSEDRIAVGAISGLAILNKADGKPIAVVGSRGKGDAQFDYVHGVAIGKDGTVYVTDSYNNRLSAYDPTGKRLWIVRTGNPANNASLVNDMLATKEATDTAENGAVLQLPLGLTLDGAGRIVVIDMFDNSLSVFNPKNGKFIGKYGESGADDGQFFYPTSVGYDPGRDWFTVADALNNRVQVVRIPGSAGSNATASVLNRTLAGPLRACIFPFLLLLLALIVWLIVRFVRRRRERAEDEIEAPEVAPEGF